MSKTIWLRVEIPDGVTAADVLAAMDDVPAEIYTHPLEGVLGDDDAMRRARAAYVAGPPHGIKHSDMDRLEHMRNAIRAAFGLALPSREKEVR